MDSHLSSLLRRSRQPHQRAAANLNVSLEKDTIEDRSLEALVKRLTPEQLSAIQADNRAAATRTSLQTSVAATRNPATPATVATEAVGGVASRIQPSPSATSSAAVISAAVPTSQAVASSSSAVRSSSSSTSTSSARPSSSSTSTIRSTSSAAPLSSSSTRGVLTVTSSRALPSSASTSSTASLTSASAAAASQSPETTGLGTGAIVGVAVACLVGLVILGSCVGWVYRKHAQRKYNVKAPWSKLDDHHDVTPFPPAESEKPYLSPDDDIYGQSPAPVIGSRRALALARQNGFNADGSVRPDSDYMFQRENNAAGYGAGRGLGAQYGAYPTMNMNNGYNYGQPTQDYGPPSPGYEYDQDQTGMAISAPGNTRQLVGPHGAPYGMPAPLAPVAMGRPAPPQSAAEFADREEYMDLPAPTPTGSQPSSGPHMSQYSTYGLAYAESEPDYMPHTATTAGWTGDAKVPHSAVAAPTPLPTIEPASPLMSSFDFKRQSNSLGPIASNFANKYGASGTSTDTTLPMYEDEDEAHRQKRMYGEVASAAGVQEPTTPHTADLSHSTNPYETASSFSAHQPEPRSISHRLPPAPMPQLPIVNLIPPQPYQHGRPLSPLTEVETPRSVAMTSSSLMHGQEINPFEESLPPPPSALRYPHSAASSTGATAFPSPAFPPPSPGGMSVPGSVSDSPRGKRESMFDGDDAYGGI